MYHFLLIYVLLCVNFFFCKSDEIPLLHHHRGTFFIDTTGTLSSSFLQTIEREAKTFEKRGFQCAGFFTNRTDLPALELATAFGNANKIGFADKDNGIAIAICLEKANPQGKKPTIGVAIGKGLEGLLNDAKVGRFLDETFVPARTQGRWEQGLITFIQKTYRYLDNPHAQEFASSSRSKDISSTAKFYLLFVVILFVIFILLSNKNSSGRPPRRPRGPFFFSGGSWGQGGSGGFSGGGGGSFGGGGSGR